MIRRTGYVLPCHWRLFMCDHTFGRDTLYAWGEEADVKREMQRMAEEGNDVWAVSPEGEKVLPSPIPVHNHMVVVAFSVITSKEVEGITKEEMLRALKERVADLEANPAEILEACSDFQDSFTYESAPQGDLVLRERYNRAVREAICGFGCTVTGRRGGEPV